MNVANERLAIGQFSPLLYVALTAAIWLFYGAFLLVTRSRTDFRGSGGSTRRHGRLIGSSSSSLLSRPLLVCLTLQTALLGGFAMSRLQGSAGPQEAGSEPNGIVRGGFCLLVIWPKGFCLKSKWTREPYEPSLAKKNIWTIHALIVCEDFVRHQSNTQEIERASKAQLEEIWPHRGRNKPFFDFLKEKWKKHGRRCFALNPKINMMQAYFDMTLALYRRFELYNTLKQAGIEPSNRRSYTLQEFNDALPNHGRFEMKCFNPRHSRASVLYEIQICLDRDYKPIDCLFERGASNECREKIFYIGSMNFKHKNYLL